MAGYIKLNMIIREALSQDANGVLKLMKQLIEEHGELDPYYKPFSKYRGLKKYIAEAAKDNNKLLLVAEIEGQIAAYFLGEIQEAPFYSNEKEIGWVADADVDPAYRRKGVLKTLYREALKWFASREIKYIELSVDSRNQPAVSAWQKLGFEKYKLRLRKKLL